MQRSPADGAGARSQHSHRQPGKRGIKRVFREVPSKAAYRPSAAANPEGAKRIRHGHGEGPMSPVTLNRTEGFLDLGAAREAAARAGREQLAARTPRLLTRQEAPSSSPPRSHLAQQFPLPGPTGHHSPNHGRGDPQTPASAPSCAQQPPSAPAAPWSRLPAPAPQPGGCPSALLGGTDGSVPVNAQEQGWQLNNSRLEVQEPGQRASDKT